MSRKQLAIVGVTGQRVQADGGSEVMVEGQEVWEDWVGQTVENTGWRGEANVGVQAKRVQTRGFIQLLNSSDAMQREARTHWPSNSKD